MDRININVEGVTIIINEHETTLAINIGGVTCAGYKWNRKLTNKEIQEILRYEEKRFGIEELGELANQL